MNKIYLVISMNDLGVDIHGAYTSFSLAEAARNKMNAEAKKRTEDAGFVYYGNRHYVLSGDVNGEPKSLWGEEYFAEYAGDKTIV